MPLPSNFIAGVEVFQKAIAAAETGEQVTRGQLATELAQAVWPEGHPKRLFYEWLREAAVAHDIPAACRALGVEPPEPGPGLVARLEELVAPKLVEEWNANSASA